MTRNRWLLLAAALILLLIIGGLGMRWWQQRSAERAAETAVDAAEQANAALVAEISASPFEKLLFLARAAGSTDLYIANVTDGSTGRVTAGLPASYSNVLPTDQTWYSVTGQTVLHHTFSQSVEIGQLPHTVTLADSLGAQASLAIDASNRYLAWVATDTNEVEAIHLFDLETKSDSTLYPGEPNLHYSNLTWSPDSSELAFTANATRLISITRETGAEINSRVTIPFSQINYLTWLDRDEFGCVLTSTDTNPDPFEPYIAVFDRSGTITERHTVFEKIGIPKVLWSVDGTEFLFHDPWKNLFFVYDRYDVAKGSVSVKAPGKLVPFGWIDGLQVRTQTTTNTINAIDVNTNSNNGTTEKPFVVTAEDWERYNTTVRSILKQFKIDFDTYRFSTTDQGLEVNFAVSSDQTQAEMIALQTIAQLYTLLPDVPAISLQINLADDSVLRLATVTSAAISALVENHTEKTLADLFVVNKQNPFGKRTIKDDGTGHHYIGDLVYSRFGDYNPLPALAQLQATLSNYPLVNTTDAATGESTRLDMQFYTSADISFLYPQTWSTKSLDEQTTLLYTSETTFASASAWSEFGITVKQYAAPDVTLEQWLSVNRRDRTVEEISMPIHQPLTGKHIVTGNDYSDEYVVQFENTVYVITLERSTNLSTADRAYLETIIYSLSANYALQRN